MARNAPILAIEREADRSGLWIGAVHEVDEKRIWLTELDTRARWKDRPLGYRLRAITSVSIDSRYLRALLAVAKPPRASATIEPEADGAERAVGHA